MSTTMTIEVRDEAYQAIRDVAARTGCALEVVAQQWVELMAQQPSIARSHTEPVADRRAFLRLSPTERRRILAEQAEQLRSHYEQDSEWRELPADVMDEIALAVAAVVECPQIA